MLVNHANITEKNYRKLTLQLSTERLAFCCTDTLSGKILWSREHILDNETTSTESNLHKLFVTETELSEAYDEVVVLHDNGYNSFVPLALFDENYLGSYLQFSTKVFETDFFSFDELAVYEMNNVFVPFANLNNLLIEKFGSFKYHHSSSALVARLLEASKNIDERQVFLHVGHHRFEMIVVQNQRLLLHNSFDFRTKEDFIYYLLFSAEQLSLNPEQFKLQLLGNVTEEDELFQMAYKYVRHTALFDASVQAEKNGQSQHENRKFFSLFQS